MASETQKTKKPCDKRGAWASRYLGFLYSNRHRLHLLLGALVLSAIYFSSGLKLKTDFATLLPDSLSSVVNARKLDERLGGNGLLVVGIVSPSYESNRAFAEELAIKFDTLVGNELRYFEYRYDDIQEYIYTYGLHYLELEKLRNFRDQLQKQIQKQKDKSFSSFLGFDDEEKSSTKDSSKLTREWVSKAFDPSLEQFLEYRDAYLSAENGKVLVFALRPNAKGMGLSQSQALVKKVQAFIDELQPKEYHPEMEVALSGNVQQSIEEFNTVKGDIVDTALLLLVLVLGLLYLFFWSLRVIVLLLSHLMIAVLFTFAITQIFIGYLNSQTAFLGSLVVGTGINYGIILLSRFLELYKKGQSPEEAVSNSLKNTVSATIIASSTTAISFIALLYNENKGLSQFAFIGGVGVALCWIMAFTYLPLWIYMIYEKYPRHFKKHPFAKFAGNLGDAAGRFLIHKSAYVTAFIVLATGFSVFGTLKLFRDPIEYNFDKVRNKKFVASDLMILRKRTNSVFSVNLNPAVVVVDTKEQAEEICPAFYRIKASLKEEDDILASCLSLYNYMPRRWPAEEAPQRRQLLAEIKSLSANKVLKYSDFSQIANGIRDKLSLDGPHDNEIPEQLLRRFTEKNGEVGLFAYVNPDSKKHINDGRNLLKFTRSMTDIELPKSHTKVTAAGSGFIFADLLEGIKRDGPPVALIAFLGVLIVTFLLAGGLRNSVFVGGCLVLGVFWMLGLQGAYSIKYNFFNFIALPLTFGLGVDYPINVFVRCRQENFKDLGKIIRGSGSAVLLCSFTTMIGYYTLLGAASQALASFARLALFGEISCLVVAVVGVPWALKVFRGKFQD